MIVFDLDDTLYKEADYVESGCRAVSDAVSRAFQPDSEPSGISAREAYDIIRGAGKVSDGFDALLHYVKQKYPESSLGIAELLRVYRFHQPRLSLDKETEETLDKLIKAGHTLGIITDGRSATQRAKISALGLERFFQEQNILISEETGTDKHSSRPFELIMKLNPGEHHFVYVGDNPEKDFMWPNRLGWQTVMLADTEHRNVHPQDLSRYQTDTIHLAGHEIPTISTLPDLLHNVYYVK